MARILVVDDSEIFRKVVSEILLAEQHEVTMATNGEEAMECTRLREFDLVITDLIMPQKEGIEMIVELQRTAPSLKIIAMSGGGRNSPTEYLSLARQLGASQTLAKPFNRDDLLQAVNQTLSESV